MPSGGGSRSEAGLIPNKRAALAVRPIARLRGSGYVCRTRDNLSGAVEVDGRIAGSIKFPACRESLGPLALAGWAWARCSAFAEEPDASIDLLDRKVCRRALFPCSPSAFAARSSLRRAALDAADFRRAHAPPWHFSAQDGAAGDRRRGCAAELDPDGAGAVPGAGAADAALHAYRDRAMNCGCARVRFPGAPWRPEATLSATFRFVPSSSVAPNGTAGSTRMLLSARSVAN